MTESVREHREAGEARGAIPVALITVSDTRDAETDRNGLYLKTELSRAGHQMAHYAIVPDEIVAVERELEVALETGARVIIFNGGTGVAARDQTIDALGRKFEKQLPGFGELFRMLSWEQIGSAAMMSRAGAGIIGSVVVFATPGSHKAVQLAWEKLIAPEIGHLVAEMSK